MKKLFFVSLFFSLFCFNVSALDANISFGTFKSGDEPYVEVYFQVVGSTVAFNMLPDSTLQANLEVVILFKQGEDIVKFDKYVLNSPGFDRPKDFVDVKRYGLDRGNYTIDVSVKDLNREGNAKKYNQEFAIEYKKGEVHLSDIQLLASLRKAGEQEMNSPMVKGGYVMEPLPSQFLDKYSERLIFYTEVYDTDKHLGEDFLLSFYIQLKNGDQKYQPTHLTHKRKSAAAVVPVLQQLDIANLESGNYQLVVQVKNKAGELLCKQAIAFQRSNPYLNVSREEIAEKTENLEDEFVGNLSDEELRYGLKAIAMQVDDVDGEVLNKIIADRKRSAMQLYLFSFWAKENPVDPEGAYNGYMYVAKAIDEKFKSGFGHGFETDRGYIYMKYGVPNDIVTVEDEQGAPPYEIWFYNEFKQTGQNNVKFLFYNPTLATNGHTLLHSTARGEVTNPQWELQLYKNAPNELEGGNFVDGTRMQDKMGRRARRLFESF